MKLTELIILSSFVITTTVLAAKTVDCSEPNVWVKGVHGKTIEECNASMQKLSKTCDADVLSSNSGEVMIKVAEANCLTDLMNAELDKRLLPLKKSDPSQFKNEMKLQKAFNTASTKACGAFNACSGTMYKVTMAECNIYTLQYRIKQALQINTNLLTVTAAKPETTIDKKLKSISELKEYSDLLCKMPKSIFKNEKIPDNCSASVTAELTAALNGDCGDEENQ